MTTIGTFTRDGNNFVSDLLPPGGPRRSPTVARLEPLVSTAEAGERPLPHFSWFTSRKKVVCEHNKLYSLQLCLECG